MQSLRRLNVVVVPDRWAADNCGCKQAEQVWGGGSCCKNLFVSVWALVLGYGFQGYPFYVYYNWFYFYAVKLRGLDIMHAAAWTSAPFLAMAALSPAGGWFSDRVARVSDRRKGRAAAVWVGMGVAALLL